MLSSLFSSVHMYSQLARDSLHHDFKTVSFEDARKIERRIVIYLVEKSMWYFLRATWLVGGTFVTCSRNNAQRL